MNNILKTLEKVSESIWAENLRAPAEHPPKPVGSPQRRSEEPNHWPEGSSTGRKPPKPFERRHHLGSPPEPVGRPKHVSEGPNRPEEPKTGRKSENTVASQNHGRRAEQEQWKQPPTSVPGLVGRPQHTCRKPQNTGRKPQTPVDSPQNDVKSPTPAGGAQHLSEQRNSGRKSPTWERDLWWRLRPAGTPLWRAPWLHAYATHRKIVMSFASVLVYPICMVVCLIIHDAAFHCIPMLRKGLIKPDMVIHRDRNPLARYIKLSKFDGYDHIQLHAQLYTLRVDLRKCN